MRLAALLLLALAAATAHAQTTRLDAVVAGVAGAEAYLDRGTADGLAAGDTVGAERDGAAVGRLRVLQATERRAVTTFAGPAFALTRGDRLTLVLREASAPALAVAAAADTVRASVPERASLLAPPAAPRRAARAPVRVTGRLQSGLLALRSSTTPAVGDAVARTFASPFATLRADVTGLPGGARLRLNGRTTYRYADAPGTDDAADLRLYEAALDVRHGRLHAEAGRFALPYERASGYWDGAAMRVGTDRSGVGAAAGVQPSRTNGLPGGGDAKAAAYAYAAHQGGALRADGALSAGRLFGGTGASFAGGNGSVGWHEGTASVRASADVLADAGANGWGLARAAIHTSARAGAWSGRAAYGRYRPSALTTALLRVGVVFAPAVRETVTAGAGVRLGARGPEVRLDGGLYRRDGAPDGTSLGGGVTLYRLPSLPLGLSVDVTRRRRDGLSSLYASATASADVSRVRLTAGYRLSQTALSASTLTQHGVEASLSAPLTTRLGIVVQSGLYAGSGLSRSSLYTSLWYRL